MPTTRRTASLTAAALLAALAAATPAGAVGRTGPAIRGHSPRQGQISESTSANWAGYDTTGGPYTRITADWVQPAVRCSAAESYSSLWIGLDGDGSKSVEQTGTEADCWGGAPQYSAWYEMYPAYPVTFQEPVRAGDRFSSSVATDGRGAFTLVLADATRHWSRTVRATLHGAALASAEIVAEAPSDNRTVLPLSDFGAASFTHATVNGLPLGDFRPDRIVMAAGRTTKALTTGLARGEDFTVTWRHS
jgi:hypothetical protein